MALSRREHLIREFAIQSIAKIGDELAHGFGLEFANNSARQVGKVDGLEMVIQYIEQLEGEL